MNCKVHKQFIGFTQISLANRKLSVKSTNKTGKKISRQRLYLTKGLMYCELEENIILRFLSHKSYHFANLSRINSRYLKTYQAVTILKPYSTFQGLNCFQLLFSIAPLKFSSYLHEDRTHKSASLLFFFVLLLSILLLFPSPMYILYSSAHNVVCGAF